MKDRILTLAVLLLLSAGGAQAFTLHFDDLGSYGYGLISNGYGGLNWNNMFWANGRYAYDTYGYNGYTNGVISPENVAFGDGEIEVVSDGLFDFNGAYFTSAWYDDNVLTLRGYRGASLIYDRSIGIVTSGPEWFAADYMQIDRLEFCTTNAQFAMDDFMFNEDMPTVPEPTSLSLIGLGLAGFVKWRSGRRNR